MEMEELVLKLFCPEIQIMWNSERTVSGVGKIFGRKEESYNRWFPHA